ncbi:alpha beta-hydrolase [Mycena filopes]|nr:alpha beta-hydrolase [Mycena filopes]
MHRTMPLSFICLLLALFIFTSSASSTVTPRGIPVSLYNDFVLYTKYSSAAYQRICPRPLGNTLVKSFGVGRTQGFVARDDTNKKIVVAFRGTFSLREALIDTQDKLVPFISPGLPDLGNVEVHCGFLGAYNNVADDILTTVKTQLADYSTYELVLTGHSLGGAIASLAAVSLKTAAPEAIMSVYTFGQPRTGNAEFATYMERIVGAQNIFRAVHTIDSIPKRPLREDGYEHSATEYWQFEDPLLPSAPASKADTVKPCAGGEDPMCSDSVPTTEFNPAHTYYFGQVMTTNPALCF